MLKAGMVDTAELLEFVTDNDIRLALAAAEAPNAAAPILDIAAHDRDRLMRLAAAKHPNTSRNTLMLLVGDADEEIAETARGRLEGSK